MSNISKSARQPSHCLEYLCIILDISQDRIFLHQEKVAFIRSHTQTVRPKCFCIRILRLIPSIQHPLQCAKIISSPWFFPILSVQQNKALPDKVTFQTYPGSMKVKLFFHPSWKVVTKDASLTGWVGVYNFLTVMWIWSPQQSKLPINILKLKAITIFSQNWIVRVPSVRVQSYNATTVACLNHQGAPVFKLH